MSENSVKTLPLQGKRILVTRTREQAATLSERLSALGAIPIEFPTIRIAPPEDWDPLDSALRRLCENWQPGNEPKPYSEGQSDPVSGRGEAGPGNPGNAGYDWLVFTSANGVNIFFDRLQHLGYNSQALRNVRIATIGPATAAALTHFGITAELIPNEYIAESVAEALIENAQQHGESLQGKRILLARAAEARKVLVTQLQAAGAIVDEIAAYRTFPIDDNDEQGREVLRFLQSAQLDILTFTSSSTVRNFVQWLKNCEEPRSNFSAEAILGNPQLTIACIGPITSQTARKLGLNVAIEAKEFTIEGLVEAIVSREERT